MELAKTYDPKSVEDKWYKYWLEQGFFHSEPDEREPYTIVIPPPNVTGVLHMGHMLNNTIQDILIRKARMQGKNACWVPGTDHASIATEAKVVAMLKEKGIDKKDLTREEFLKYAWEWKEKYGGIILKQLEKLGASCDWERTRFTMEDDLSEAVIDVFIDLHKKGQIYRGVRMVNWDPQGLTAISDEEVIHKEVNSKLYYIKYRIADENGAVRPLSLGEGTEVRSDEWITIATTRPETILGDTAVCVHPDDPRYAQLKGKKVIIPIVNRAVPVIFDDYIDMEFGTGALKVTPAHDINDYNLGIKHNLEVIDTLTPAGKMSPAAGFYIGEDRFTVRKKIIEDLKELGQVVKIDEIKNKVGTSERTGAVIEPRLSMQWFLKMDTLSKPALENVLNGNIKLIPEKFINTYKHWMENVHDWCISRQLWWGQQIPAWYDEKGNLVAVCKTKEEALQIQSTVNSQQSTNLVQDEDVLDTWFSSWLWPISVFDGFKNPNGKDINYYYPTNDLVTAPEILFFWVARMIIAGYEYRHDKPFTNVYLTGIVRDKLGRKMSKSLGNSPDPLDLIAKYGADGVRAGMLYCSPAGNDLLFDEGLCEQGRNFTNKIWNAFRLVKGWGITAESNHSNQVAIDWFDARCNKVMEQLEDHYSKYRISDALMTIYKLIWDDFCSWYLEMIKPEFVEGKSLPIDQATYDATIAFFERIMKLLHPIMPFVTEEIYQLLKDRSERDSICISTYPKYNSPDEKLLAQADLAIDIITGIREVRAKAQKKNHETVSAHYTASHDAAGFGDFASKIMKLCKLDEFVSGEPAADFVVNQTLVIKDYKFFVRTGEVKDSEAEREKLLKELDYTKGFLASIEKKLANEKFVSNAPPQVLETENKKKDDALRKIAMIEETLGV
jgi:valyl-tRNA synthetase